MASVTVLAPPYHLLGLDFALALFDGFDHVAAGRYTDSAGETVDHVVRNALGNKASKFTFFALVFLSKTGLDRLVHVFAA